MSLSLFVYLNVLLLVYILWVAIYLGIYLYMEVWVMHNNLYLDISLKLSFISFSREILKCEIFLNFVNSSAWCVLLNGFSCNDYSMLLQ